MARNLIRSALDTLLFWKKKRPSSHVEKLGTVHPLSLSTAKQQQLEILCNQLFAKKELITSGKLQFIGLEKVRKHMGRQWPKLRKIVYSTAEKVINEHLEKGDLSIQYKDDSYVIIFARASLQEGQAKAASIAEEIRKRLFGLKDDALKDVDIRQIICEIRTDVLVGKKLPEIVHAVAEKAAASPPPPQKQAQVILPSEYNTTQVGTGPGSSSHPSRLQAVPAQRSQTPSHIDYSYLPLWDTKKGALAAYLCLAKDPAPGGNDFEYHQSLFNHKKIAEKLALDIATLNIVAAEFESMAKEGKRLLIVCPVQYDTLFNYDAQAEYKRHLLRVIPAEYRQLLEILVQNIPHSIVAQDAFWFVTPMRQACRDVLAEVHLRRDVDFQYLHHSGFNVVGVRLHRHAGTSEQELISLLNGFSARAKAMKMPRIFVLDVSTLSLTTSAVCAGFECLGGSAIHESVTKPDHIYRYRHADLLTALIKQ